MTEKSQPEALRLAEWMECGGWPSYAPQEAAAELRRLHALNAELVAVVRQMLAVASAFDAEVVETSAYELLEKIDGEKP